MKLQFPSTYESERPECKATLCSFILKSFGELALIYHESVLRGFDYIGQKSLVETLAVKSFKKERKKERGKESKPNLPTSHFELFIYSSDLSCNLFHRLS